MKEVDKEVTRYRTHSGMIRGGNIFRIFHVSQCKLSSSDIVHIESYAKLESVNSQFFVAFIHLNRHLLIKHQVSR